MEKNWLIRTKNNHILGPVSKDKVIELYKNGSIKSEDEICSGNGYWFFVREKNLIEKYLIGNEIQQFNPVSEAENTPFKNENQTQVIHLDDIKDEERQSADEITEKKTQIKPLEKNDEKISMLTDEKLSQMAQKVELVQVKIKRDASDFIIFAIASLLLVLAVMAFYYRNQILQRFISLNFIAPTYAQVSVPSGSLVKKKVLSSILLLKMRVFP